MRENGLQYVLASPGGTITYNPTNFTPPGHFLDDIDFAANLRTEIVDRPQAHGSYMDNANRSGMSGIIESTVIGTSAANRQTLLDALFQAYLSMMGEEGTATLTWTHQGGGSQRRLEGLQIIDYPRQIRRGGTIKGYHVAMMCEKGYAEDASATVVDSVALTAIGGGWTIPLVVPVKITSSGGGTASVTNNGTTTAMPILRIYGPITSPNVVNVTSGKRLVFTGSIAIGDYWEIDLFQQSVKLNGITTVTTLDVSQSTWFSLARGASTLQLTGSAYTAATLLRVFMRSCWG